MHIIVPGSEAHKTFLLGNSDDDECGAIESALYKSGNIYFPADGTQPTTKEAVEYSCANVNDDAITNWYMMMFGWIPEDDTEEGANYNDSNRLKLGYEELNKKEGPIIFYLLN